MISYISSYTSSKTTQPSYQLVPNLTQLLIYILHICNSFPLFIHPSQVQVQSMAILCLLEQLETHANRQQTLSEPRGQWLSFWRGEVDGLIALNKIMKSGTADGVAQHSPLPAALPTSYNPQQPSQSSSKLPMRREQPIVSPFTDSSFLLATPPTLPAYEPYLPILKSLPRPTHHLSTMKALLKTQFSLLPSLCHGYFQLGFFGKQDQHCDLFLIWMDNYVSEEFVKRLRGYQRVNHFPGSCQLGRKDQLAHNLNAMQNALPGEFAFFPRTWVLPAHHDQLMARLKEGRDLHPQPFYIVKPHANCQGRGISLSRWPTPSLKDEVIVQQYLPNPLLLDNCKFDLRIYVLLRSLDPLQIYIYEQGLCRLATAAYLQPSDGNYRNERMHLTNYAVNKCAPDFQGNKDYREDGKGHKRTLTAAMRQLKERGFDTDKIKERIDSVVIKTILAATPKMLNSYRRARRPPPEQKQEQESVCFQLMGFDIMLLSTGEPILLEVNHMPSLVTDSPLDLQVKKHLLMDTINLLHLSPKDREEWERTQREGSVYRPRHEEGESGGFRRVLPVRGEGERERQLQDYYDRIMDRIMIKESKKYNQAKLNIKYRTLSTRQSSNRHQDNQTDHPQQTPLPLTFYNLFSHSKYRIVRSNHPPSLQDDSEDLPVRNHIFIEMEKPTIKRIANLAERRPLTFSLEQKDQKDQKDMKERFTDTREEIRRKKYEKLRGLTDNTLLSDEITVQTRQQTRWNLLAKNRNDRSFKVRPTLEDSHTIAYEDKALTKMADCKEIYCNSIREKMDRISNLKAIKHNIQRLNFITRASSRDAQSRRHDRMQSYERQEGD